MTGHIYSNMPDTTSRMAPYRRSIRRLIASISLFASSLLLVASMGLAQDGNDVSCEEFDSPEAAMEYVADNPDAESALDSDGDGTVCNEEPSLFTDDGDVEERDEFADEIEDDRANDEDDSGDSTDQARQTPATGGIALLPLAGSVLTAGFGGFTLVRRR